MSGEVLDQLGMRAIFVGQDAGGDFILDNIHE